MSWITAGTLKNQYELYAQMEAQYGRHHERFCIDGKRTASCKCKGFCMYDVHPGFITESLQTKKKCVEKNCRHYLPKPKKIRSF